MYEYVREIRLPRPTMEYYWKLCVLTFFSAVFAQDLPFCDTCNESCCYPPTGNLLIGRENHIRASSTCGIDGMERYCIPSHRKERKKCFQCNSGIQFKENERLYHGIENVVSSFEKRRRTWWQSENGVEGVSIQLDLEAEFEFTHLAIKFKSLPPAAMLIERSRDFGRTWKVYQYFAHDCGESFPGISHGPRKQITDLVCDSHYSGTEPSTGAEVMFEVLPPNLALDNPRNLDVLNLKVITNLRINFTKLHTLGEDLLDADEEIKENYYYAVYDMVVRGSCFCYGHGKRCVPELGSWTLPGMVYSRCECMHNTKGVNCEMCEDAFNDQPWRPAVGRQINACKRCNCNGHAVNCHFDFAMFEYTGRMSGGVCDACEHNTYGRNCELCKPFFYRIPGRNITDPDICQACNCDPRGSLDGLCDDLTGRCVCKANFEGQRCDRCKPGLEDLQGVNPGDCERL